MDFIAILPQRKMYWLVVIFYGSWFLGADRLALDLMWVAPTDLFSKWIFGFPPSRIFYVVSWVLVSTKVVS
jgi:hypothetical protein